jgi:hypothetical protein
MNTRRQFFGNLFKGIVVAGAAPSVIVSRFGDRQLWKPSRQVVTLEITTSPIVAHPRKLETEWTIESEQYLHSYYGIDAEEYMNNLIKRTKKVPYNNYASYTHIPESIAKQPIDPNADYSEIGNVARDLVKKVFAELKDNKN